MGDGEGRPDPATAPPGDGSMGEWEMGKDDPTTQPPHRKMGEWENGRRGDGGTTPGHPTATAFHPTLTIPFKSHDGQPGLSTI